jgi:hypothetical protein
MAKDEIREAEIQETGRIVRLIMRETGLRYDPNIFYRDKGRSLEYSVTLTIPNRSFLYKAILTYQYGYDLFDFFLFRMDRKTYDQEKTETIEGMYAEDLPNAIRETFTSKRNEWFPIRHNV